MSDEEAYAAAIDVVDASDEKDEREDPPAQSGYGAAGPQQPFTSGWIALRLRGERSFVPR